MITPEGSGDVIINDWITLKSNPTVTGGTVINIPDKALSSYVSSVKSWYAFENLANINAEARKVIGNKNEVVIDELRQLKDKDKRYWVAVGPNVMNTSHNFSDDVTISEMRYGAKVDVVFQDSSGVKLYLPCVVGDVKAHTYPNGIYQTGFGYKTPKDSSTNGYSTNNVKYTPELEDDLSIPYNDRSVIEFIGNWPGDENDVRNTKEVQARIMKGINSTGLNEYKIISVIVY